MCIFVHFVICFGIIVNKWINIGVAWLRVVIVHCRVWDTGPELLTYESVCHGSRVHVSSDASRVSLHRWRPAREKSASFLFRSWRQVSWISDRCDVIVLCTMVTTSLIILKKCIFTVVLTFCYSHFIAAKWLRFHVSFILFDNYAHILSYSDISVAFDALISVICH